MPPRKHQKTIDTEKAVSAGMIIYRRTDEGPKFLVMYHRGRYWNFPKGSIEAGEDSLQAAMREVREETGLAKSELRIKRGFKAQERFQFMVGRKKVYKKVILFLAETRRKGIDISGGSREEGFGWFLYRDAKRLFEGYRESQLVLKKAYDFIQGSRRPFYRSRRGPQKSRRSSRRH